MIKKIKSLLKNKKQDISYLSENKRHFKGTFKMTVYHENTSVEKHITQGHFNINLDTVNNQ